MGNTAPIGIGAPPVSTTEFIGPLEARKLLANSAPNRAINDTLVLRYACEMLDGEWHNIGVPIILDEHGRLSDGQHRLSAVIESETVQQFTLVRGVPLRATILAVDTGRKRTITDILRIITDNPDEPHEFKHIKNLPSIARRVMAYQMTGDMNVDSAAIKRLTTAQQVDFIRENQFLLESAARWAKRIAPICSMSVSGAGGAFFVTAQASPALGAEFAGQICDPSQTRSNPAWLLREQASKDALRRTYSWVKDARLTGAMYIKAFNAYCAGVCPKQIHFKAVGPAAESFPQVEV